MSRPSPFTGPSSVVMLEDRPRSPTAKLTRFAPDRRDWVLFDTAQENEFLSWWLETDYGQQLTKNGKYKFRWSVESRSSKVWKHFDQVAELRSGRPKVVCRSCLTPLNHPHHPHHKSHGTSTMGKHLKSNSCRRSVEKVSISAVTPGPIQAARASFSPTRSRFTKAQLEDQLLRTITSANLSFELTEEPTFRELLDLVYAGPQVLDIPSSKQLRQHMHDMVTTYEESQLQDLPGDSKVSLALCCWKSPLGQDFMAITAYYFDKKWSYREVLLGFELLSRPETGTDPGDQILGLIMNKGLLRRIFSVTIDYRVDEKLVLSLQEKLTSSGGISSWQCFVGIPGTVQAIQLCLRRYIGNITSSPEGERVENVRAISHVNGWTDRSDGDEITHVLEKIRSFAKFVNETPRKRDEFLCLQPARIRLLPLDDENTRWNSVFLMLKRAGRLRRFIDQYCQESENCPYKLTNADWRKVDYLVQLTMPFIQFTTALLASKEAAVHKVCFVFKILMEHLDESTQILRRKSAPWKRKLLEASLIMKMEFGEVYEKTFQNFGVMYGPGTFVAPQYKVSAFDEATSSQGLGRSERHIEYLRIFHLQYRPEIPTSLSCVNGLSCSPQLLGLDRLLHPLAGLAGSSRSGQDEVDQYLREGVVNISPSAYWKDHQREWPVLTRLARDLLSIPATGAGAERLFTVAQNIYYTRGGSLDESAMRDLVMYAYSEGSESGKQLISQVERDTASDEEWEEFEVEAERPEPISDDEWGSAEMSVDERSEDDENSKADTVILESPPTDDLEQDLADKGEDSFLLPPVTWLINSIRRRFSGGATVTQ
ncbi:hypothetical protein CBS147333_9810 [Penicillium roqueforti]|nr:hypothetical protein CBS147333_9810 [Penicillium roqueforti]KAI3190767.1 hypothetical protein CBS147311_9722 [Penicillium roqueforti]KAI3261771.1 hypothetical protein CBS147308_9635 [Penicillium roqueforti]KAI3279489.1 hypothetical protein DTO003C3_9755 [Penicillium roqueforti]